MLKRYFISTLATITGLWITLGVLFFSGFIILAAVGASSTSEEIVDISSNSILHIKLEGEAVERFRTYNFIDEVQGTAVNIFPLNETIAAIKEAAVNSNFSGIFIEANGLSAAPASLAEIRQALEEFKKSGKGQREWCREAGIKRSTLRYWLERSEELAEGKEIRFARIVEGGEKKC